MEVTSYISEHPYFVGGTIVAGGLLFILLRSGGGNSSPNQTATGATQQAPAPNAAVQVAQIQSQAALTALGLQNAQKSKDNDFALAKANLETQASLQGLSIAGMYNLQGQQISAQVAQASINSDLQLAQTQLDATKVATAGAVVINGQNANTTITTNASNNKTAVDLATINAATTITLNNTNNDTTRLGITTQGQIEQAKTSAAVTMAQDANATSLAINGQNAGAAVIINGQNTGAAVIINGQNTDAAVKISGNTTAAQINGQNIAGEVTKTAILVQGQTDQAAIDAMRFNAEKFYGALDAGVFNKGGAGGANQVSVFGAFTGNPSVGAPAQASQAGNSPGAILAGVSKIALAILG